MKCSILFCLALAVAPVAVRAQEMPPPGGPAFVTPSAQTIAAMRQSHAKLQILRQQERSQMLATLAPAHRSMLANLVGQLALSVDPNPRAAAAQFDAVLAPAEKQSILNIAAAERTNTRAIMQQTRAAVEATMSADERAQMTQRDAAMEGFRRKVARPAGVADPGMIVLRTLSSFAPEHGYGGPSGPPM